MGFSSVHTGTRLTSGDQFVAGAAAGVATSLLVCPMELIKCRLQAQPSAPAPVGGTLQVVAFLLAFFLLAS